jgi:hypothetical protein
MRTFLRVAVSFLFLAHGGDNLSSGGGGRHDAILLSSSTGRRRPSSNHYQHQRQPWLTNVIGEGQMT